jgi:site-specific recombinase XerD
MSLGLFGNRKLATQLVRKSQSIAAGQAPLRLPDLEAPIGNSRPDFLLAVEHYERNTAFGSRETAKNFARRKRTLLKYCGCWSDFQSVAIWKMYDECGYVSAPNQLHWFLRSFVEHCVNRGWLAESDWKEVSKIPRKVVPPRRVQIPASNEVRDLLLMCEAESFELGQFIRWLALSGLRLSGAAGIRWEEINFSAGEYRRKMKGGCEVVIPLLPDALSLLLNRWTSAGKPRAGLVFEMGDYRIKRVRRLLRKYAVGLGLGLTYPHALRHHFASVAFANGFSAGEVAQMLGHKDGGALALQVYGHVIPTQLKMKVANLRMAG